MYRFFLRFAATTVGCVFIVFLLSVKVPSQRPQLRAEVFQQIQSLAEAKMARSAAQNKINSNLLYTIQMNRGEDIAAGVQKLETGLSSNEFGYIDVEIRADVSKRLLRELAVIGAEIKISLPEYRSITASMPIQQIERLAGFDEVFFIAPEEKPVRANLPRLEAAFFTNSFAPGFGGLFTNKLAKYNERVRRVRHALGAYSDDLFPQSGSKTSEGDATHAADVFRSTTGFNGTGVKIGVLSNGVKSLAVSQASGDLPANVTVLQNGGANDDEGTAMLEIVHDLAPGAQLYFATGNGGTANFASNIRSLRVAGCSIIVDDILYPTESAFQNGQTSAIVSPSNGGLVTQAVNDVTVGSQAGALYFSSALNYGSKLKNTGKVWEGDFRPGSSISGLPGTTHVFPVDLFGTTFFDQFDTITVGGTSPLYLQWSDPLGASANDYDMYVLNNDANTILAAATDRQTGTQDPLEIIAGNANINRNSNLIVVVKFSGANRYLRLFKLDGAMLATTGSSTYAHNAAVNALSVAAAPAGPAVFGQAGSPTGPYPNLFNAANQLEVFSSDGPRKIFYNADGSQITPGNVSSTGGITLQKPDFSAADGVTTTVPGFIPFYGTSAAAPHAGAIAALLKSARPAATNGQIVNALKSTAIDIEGAGTDVNSGAGIIMPIRALNALSTPSPTPTPTPTPTPSPTPTPTVSGISINDVSQNEGNAGTTAFIFTVNVTPPSAQAVTVNYATATGTAVAPGDYTAVPSTLLVFGAGEASKTVTVLINGDTTVEPNETFTVNLSNPSNSVITDNVGLGTIVNDDGVQPSISINDVSANEGNTGTTPFNFTVTLSAASSQVVTVNYATASGTALFPIDFNNLPSTLLTFNAGETSKQLTVNVNGDTDIEPDETFFVNLSSPVNATISDNQGVGTIKNDDACTYQINPTSQGFQIEGGSGSVQVTAPTGCAWTAAPGSSLNRAGSQPGSFLGLIQPIDVFKALPNSDRNLPDVNDRIPIPANPSAGFSEGFDSVQTLTSSGGWFTVNHSTGAANSGIIGWGQCAVPSSGVGIPPAHSGTPNTSCALVNYSSSTDGTINNWFIAPTTTFSNGDTVSFYTRTPNNSFPDRLQVRLSKNGASTNVGTLPTDVGDYTTLLLDIDADYSGTYPTTWTQFTVTISGLAAPTSGRIAFRYFVEDGGPDGVHSNIIGIDDFVYTQAPPASFLTITGGQSSTGNGTVNYSVGQNTSGSPRTGTMTIAGQTFTINQSVASTVLVSGKVKTPGGAGLKSAQVTLQGPSGTRVVTTNSFGLFSFDGVPSAQTYTVGASSKKYRFSAQTMLINTNITLPDFVGLE